MKKTIAGILAALFTCITLAPALALDKGNDRKGKYTYRNVYKSCLQRGAVDSSRPKLNPDVKTRAQWTRLFEKEDFGELGCPEEWGKLSREELSDIYSYLWEHAADSPTPAKCK
ncbi:MAG: cytochrome c family protein [Desulfobacteraceae bacterium]|nr:MAG: cytochrome c family protein [Desulfobacteraceae bacterium]